MKFFDRDKVRTIIGLPIAALVKTPAQVFDPYGLNAALELRRAARPARQEAARLGAQTRKGREA